MNIFCLVITKPAAPPPPKTLDGPTVLRRGRHLIPFPNPVESCYSLPEKGIHLYSWATPGLPENPNTTYFQVSDDGTVTTWSGWIADVDRPSTTGFRVVSQNLNLRTASFPASVVGEFVAAKITKHGTGVLCRNLSGMVPLYHYEDDDFQVFSNRAPLIDGLFSQRRHGSFDELFLASMLGIGWQITTERTLFEDIRLLPQGASVSFKGRRVRINTPGDDPWFDEEGLIRYQKNRTAYWDDVYEGMRAQIRVLPHIAADRRVTLKLSGGKDSRLLLSLLLAESMLDGVDRIESNGPPYASDVIIGHHIGRRYGLEVHRSDSIFSDNRFSERLKDHIFLTEGSISPFNLCYHPNYSDKGTVLPGHEIGLREVSNAELDSIDDVMTWVERHYKKFDTFGILTTHYQQILREYTRQFFESASRTVARISDLPTRHRLETRYYRWAGAIHAFESARCLYPHFLGIDDTIVGQYSIGVQPRLAEELHFEIMRRADPWLVETCPFAQQKWSESLAGRLETYDRGFSGCLPDLTNGTLPATPGLGVLRANGNQLIDWLGEGTGADWGLFTLDELSDEKLENADGRQAQCFWNLVQIELLTRAGDFSEFSLWQEGGDSLQLPELLPPTTINIGRLSTDQNIRALQLDAALAETYGAHTLDILLDNLDRLVEAP